jgi:acyl-CoA dehydrogenase
MKAQDTSELFFDGVRVPVDNLLGGREGQGFYQLMGDLPYERLIIGVAALAGMEGAYEATLAYVRERQAFGQPVANFQNTRFRLAEVATQISVGRAFIDRCVEQLVAGTLDTATASMAKLWAPRRRARARRAAAAARRLRLHERVPDRPHVRGRPRDSASTAAPARS